MKDVFLLADIQWLSGLFFPCTSPQCLVGNKIVLLLLVPVVPKVTKLKYCTDHSDVIVVKESLARLVSSIVGFINVC